MRWKEYSKLYIFKKEKKNMRDLEENYSKRLTQEISRNFVEVFHRLVSAGDYYHSDWAKLRMLLSTIQDRSLAGAAGVTTAPLLCQEGKLPAVICHCCWCCQSWEQKRGPAFAEGATVAVSSQSHSVTWTEIQVHPLLLPKTSPEMEPK